MIRFLYVSLLRLHPRQFRLRHGDEMLSAFDHSALDGSAGRLRLFTDGLASLIRQWTLRPAAQAAAIQPVEGASMFQTLDTGMPGRTALAYGGVIALASFAVLAFAALRGAGRLPSWGLFETVRGQVYAPQSWPAASFTRSSAARTPTLFQELDRDGDGVLSAAEIDGATATLMALLGEAAPRTTDAASSSTVAGSSPVIGGGTARSTPVPQQTPATAVTSAPSSAMEGSISSVAGSPAGRRSSPRGTVRGRVVYLDPLLAAFDLNHDGYLSQDELDYAPVVLSSLDRNHDGKLTLDEIQ